MFLFSCCNSALRSINVENRMWSQQLKTKATSYDCISIFQSGFCEMLADIMLKQNGGGQSQTKYVWGALQ